MYVNISEAGFSSLTAAVNSDTSTGGLTNGFVVPPVTLEAVFAYLSPVSSPSFIFLAAAQGQIGLTAKIGKYSFFSIIQKIISNEKGLSNDRASLVIPFKRQSGCTFSAVPELTTPSQTNNMPGSWVFIVTGILSGNPVVQWWMVPTVGLNLGMPLFALGQSDVGLIEMYNSEDGATFLFQNDPFGIPNNSNDNAPEGAVAANWGGGNLYVLAQL